MNFETYVLVKFLTLNMLQKEQNLLKVKLHKSDAIKVNMYKKALEFMSNVPGQEGGVFIPFPPGLVVI